MAVALLYVNHQQIMEEKDLHFQLQKTDEIPKNEFEKK